MITALTLCGLCLGCEWIAPYGSASASGQDAGPNNDGALDGDRFDSAQTSEARPLTDLVLSEVAPSDASTTFSAPWLKHIPSSDSVRAPLVATDPSTGNIVVALDFKTDVDASDGETLASAGETDILLASYDSSGALRWKKRFGDATREHAQGLATDGQGQIVLAGYLGGSVDFGGGPLAGGGGGGIFIASFDPDGTHRWSKGFGEESVSEAVTALAVDAAGNTYLAGTPNLGQDFGGGALSTENDEDAFLVSFDEDGNHRWSKPIGGRGTRPLDDESIDALAFDESSSELLLAGTFNDTIDLGGNAFVSAGGDDIFFARFDNAGNPRWSKSFGSQVTDEPMGLAVDHTGNAYLVGKNGAVIDFGGSPLPFDVAGTFLASFDGAGAHRWSRRLTAAEVYASLAVATDASGDVYVVGDFTGAADLGGEVLDLGLGSHLFVASYTPWNTHRFSSAFGDVSSVSHVALDSVSDEKIVIAGTFIDTLTIDGQSITSAASSDGFILSLEP